MEPRTLKKKRDLDRAVAEIMGMKVPEVSIITELFLQEVTHQLVDQNDVRLDGLGTLHVACKHGCRSALLTNGYGYKTGKRDTMRVEVKRKYYVSLRKGNRLREALWARFGKLKQQKVKGE